METSAFEIVIREIYNSIRRRVLNSDSYKAELSGNRVTPMKNGADKETVKSVSCSKNTFCTS